MSRESKLEKEVPSKKDRMLKFIGYISIHLIYALICKKSTEFAILTTIVMSILTPIYGYTDDWEWFDWVKRYSLLIGSIIAYTPIMVKKYSNNNQFDSLFSIMGTGIMALNVIEAGASEIQQKNIYNGILCIITGLLTPKFKFNKNYSGFTSLLWWSCYYGTLHHFILYNKFWKGYRLTTIPTKTIPFISIFFTSPLNHLPIRIGWITFQSFIDTVIDYNWQGTLSYEEELITRVYFSTNKTQYLKYGLTAINTAMVSILIYSKVKSYNF